jgi:hypothetical protein
MRKDELEKREHTKTSIGDKVLRALVWNSLPRMEIAHCKQPMKYPYYWRLKKEGCVPNCGG